MTISNCIFTIITFRNSSHMNEWLNYNAWKLNNLFDQFRYESSDTILMRWYCQKVQYESCGTDIVLTLYERPKTDIRKNACQHKYSQFKWNVLCACVVCTSHTMHFDQFVIQITIAMTINARQPTTTNSSELDTIDCVSVENCVFGLSLCEC